MLTAPTRDPPWTPPARAVVAVGLFDGVHCGHRALLAELSTWAQACGAAPVVITFDPHPDAVLSGAPPPLVVTPAHRVRLIRELGIAHVWLLALDGGVLRLTAREFLQRYVCAAVAGRGLLVGFNNRLGRDRAGYGELAALGGSLKLEVRECPATLVDGVPVSSTRVRQAIVAGDLARARRLLGRSPSVAGRVVAGRGRGRGLGFPTANIRPGHEAVVPCGVYEGEVSIDGRTYRAAVSIGACPTFAPGGGAAAHGAFEDGSHTIEAHILEFRGDLLGREIEVRIHRALRKERVFDSAAALAVQIRADIDAIRQNAP